MNTALALVPHTPRAESFQWTRKVPKAWQKDLDQLAQGERVSSLHLTWQAGWPWSPVQRWEIYEVVPKETIARILTQEDLLGITDSLTRGLWNAVRGVNPRTDGRWVVDPDIPQHMGGKKWRSNSLVSQTQWLLHQQTGGMPHRCWIIEGNRGGHALRLGSMEKSFLLASGVEPEDVQKLADAWPNPGDLPYAEYDSQTFNALAERDRLLAWKLSKPWDARVDRQTAMDLVLSERATRHEDVMKRVVKWIDHQIGGFVSDIPRTQMQHITHRGPANVATDAPANDLLKE